MPEDGADVSPGGTDPEELRRRLYRAAATEQDLARYRIAVAGRPDAGGAPALPARPAAALAVGRARRPAILPVLVAAVTVAAIAVAATVLTAAPRPARPAPSTATVAPLDPVAISASSRVRLAGRIERGDPAALSAFFLDHPESIPDAIRGTSRADTQESSGVGTRTVALDPSGLAMRGGRLTVVLALDRPGDVEWRAVRDVSSEQRAGTWQIVTRRSATYGTALPLSATIPYRAAPPTGLHVVAPRDTHWSAAVVFTD